MPSGLIHAGELVQAFHIRQPVRAAAQPEAAHIRERIDKHPALWREHSFLRDTEIDTGDSAAL